MDTAAAWAFAVAAALFVFLISYDGYSALAAHGIDVRLTDEAASQVLHVVSVTWPIAFVCAMLGLAACFTDVLGFRTHLIVAVAEVAVMLAFIIATSAVTETASTMHA